MSNAVVTYPGELGQIKRRDQVGLAGKSLVIWNACPGCGCERWSLLALYNKHEGRVLCSRCVGRSTINRNNLQWWNESEHRPYCSCARCADQRGVNNKMWNGGVTRTRDGYKLVKVYPGDEMHVMADAKWYVLEHRLVMARAIGRPLMKGETVHHINGVRDDNRVENLELWYTNHGHGARVSDLLKDWAQLYGYHCPGCNCDKVNHE